MKGCIEHLVVLLWYDNKSWPAPLHLLGLRCLGTLGSFETHRAAEGEVHRRRAYTGRGQKGMAGSCIGHLAVLPAPKHLVRLLCLGTQGSYESPSALTLAERQKLRCKGTRPRPGFRLDVNTRPGQQLHSDTNKKKFTHAGRAAEGNA